MCDPDECGCVRPKTYGDVSGTFADRVGKWEIVSVSDGPDETPQTTRLSVARLHQDALTALYLNGTIDFNKFRDDMAEIVTFIGCNKHQLNEPVEPGYYPAEFFAERGGEVV